MAEDADYSDLFAEEALEENSGIELPDETVQREEVLQPEEELLEEEIWENEDRHGHWVIRVSGIELITSKEREYDGTDDAAISWQTAGEFIPDDEEVYTSDAADEEAWKEVAFSDYEGMSMDLSEAVIAEAHLESADAGRQRVIYAFSLREELPEETVLMVEEKELYVTVIPKYLTVTLPDGCKYYHEEADLSHIYLDGEIVVTGFLTDSAGEELIPEDFVYPAIAVDRSILKKDTPMYGNAADGVEHALVLATRSDGSIKGNPGQNYRFDTAHVRGGRVTILESPVQEDLDYALYGEENASGRDRNGQLWIRSGTAMHIEVFERSGYSAAASVGNGEYRLERRDSSGQILALSDPFYPSYREDGEAPQIGYTLEGGRTEAEIYWSRVPVDIDLERPADDGSGVERAFYEIHEDAPDGKLWEEGSLWDEKRICLVEEGDYYLTIKAADLVGNESQVISECIRIDKTVPEVTISGIEDQEVSEEAVRVRVRVRDAHLSEQGTSATIEGVYGQTHFEGETAITEDGIRITFPEIPKRSGEDDIYFLNIHAEDQAGNRIEKQWIFTVNQTGSVYRLDDDTAAYLQDYWHKEAFPVVFEETNLTQIQSAEIVCIHEHEVTSLSTGEIEITSRQMENGRWLYRYTIPSAYFSEEGTYELYLRTTDAAGRKKDSVQELLKVHFGIDRSRPKGVIAGADDGAIIEAGTLVMAVDGWDNQSLAGLRLFADGKAVLEKSGEALNTGDTVVKYTLEGKGEWQTLQLYVWDAAGNGGWSEKLTVYAAKHLPSRIPNRRQGRQGYLRNNTKKKFSKDDILSVKRVVCVLDKAKRKR